MSCWCEKIEYQCLDCEIQKKWDAKPITKKLESISYLKAIFSNDLETMHQLTFKQGVECSANIPIEIIQQVELEMSQI